MLQPHLAALETIQPLWLGRFLFLLFSVVLTALIFPAGAGRRVSRGICHTKCPHKCDGKIKWPFLKSLLCTEFSAFTQHNLIDQIMPEQHTTPEVQALRSKKDWFFTQAHAPVSFPGGAAVKNPPANAGDTRDVGSIPGSGRSPRVGNGNSAPVFLPEKFHGLRGHRVPYDWTHAPAHTHTHTPGADRWRLCSALSARDGSSRGCSSYDCSPCNQACSGRLHIDREAAGHEWVSHHLSLKGTLCFHS